MSDSKDRNDRTSAGVRWEEVPEHSRSTVEWIDGRHGSGVAELPSIEEMPIPYALLEQPCLHPDRPRGSKAMLDVAGAKARLKGARPGAWLVSPMTGHKWAMWPGARVGWLPDHVHLHPRLCVSGRDDLQ